MNSTRGEKKDGGFSLVEIIVVIAIMAILVGVLAPMYLRYVEKARMRKDEAAAEEILHAAEIVVFSGEYAITTGTVVVTFDKANGIAVTNDPLGTQLTDNLSELFGTLSKVKPESNAYADKVYKVSIVASPTADGIPSMAGAWY
ncbi:MAG: prepilin-type N-terminal cleavage/methylation domain-containing protein [Lachnospiraceae bacterium]|nr:prepilin-type N-terminal cleavage/methylation domain-containing protein [Lachnospiraceae bacterium]